MARGARRARLRHNRRATGGSMEALAAVTVVVVVVALVLALAHSSGQRAQQEAARSRALTQGEVVLESLAGDPALDGKGQAILWQGALRVARGEAALAFAPGALRVLSLRAVAEGGEVFLVGDTAAAQGGLVFASSPVLLETADGRFVPGVARAGVAPT